MEYAARCAACGARRRANPRAVRCARVVGGPGLRRRARLGASRSRTGWSCAAAGLRSRRHRGIRRRAASPAARSAAELRDLVLPARRGARERVAGQARRCDRRQCVVVPPTRLRVPARVAACKNQEAPDRVRLGPDQRPHAAACGDDRVRGQRRARRRQRIGICQRARPAGAAAGQRRRPCPLRAGILVVARRRPGTGAGRRSRDRMDQRPRGRQGAEPDDRSRASARIRRPHAALAAR